MIPSCSVLTDLAELEALRPAWEALLARSEANELMLTPDWLLPWWRVFGSLGGRRLQVGIFKDGARLVGLAPLLRRTHWYQPAIPFRRLELLGSGEPQEDEVCSEYLDLIAERGLEPEVAESFVRALHAGVFGAWDELILTSMRATSPVLPGLVESANRAGMGVEQSASPPSAYIELPSTFGAYLEQLSAPSRYLVTRSLRDFEAWAGGLDVRRCTTRAELEEGRRALIALHTERWSGAGAFTSPRFDAFHREVMPRLLDTGSLELLWLPVRGEPVAAAYNLVWHDRVYFYQTGRRLDLPRRIRPGIVIQAYSIQRAISLGRREYDFLGSGPRYKRQLALATRPLASLRLLRQRGGTRERARRILLQGFEGARMVREAIAPPPVAPTTPSPPTTAARDEADDREPSSGPISSSASSSRTRHSKEPGAVLTGDLNMLRCFANTGVPTVVLSSDPEEPCFYSRHCGQRRLVASSSKEPEQALRDLSRLGELHYGRPVLFYGEDASLLLVSRNREQLARWFRFLMPPPDVIEALVDKTRFAELAKKLDLPVPRTVASADVTTAEDVARRVGTPSILKPFCHIGWQNSGAIAAMGGKPFKALRADSIAELRERIEQLRTFSPDFVIQELVPGGEEQIYTFHAYLDAGGRPLGHFVGKKIRTYPRMAGMSTYLELTDEPDLTRQALDSLARLGMVGPVKLDYKRDPSSGRFYLLEVNPRFSLWNHLGAASGVNLPLVAYRDLTGQAPEAKATATPGVRWLALGDDARAFLRDYRPAGELDWTSWLRSLRGPKVYDVFAWDDASPLVMTLAHTLRDRRASRRARAHQAGARPEAQR